MSRETDDLTDVADQHPVRHRLERDLGPHRREPLQVQLAQALQRLPLGGLQASILGYNGGVPGPTLRVRGGDTLQIELVNNLGVPTNLHVHGLVVSPRAPGDDGYYPRPEPDTLLAEPLSAEPLP